MGDERYTIKPGAEMLKRMPGVFTLQLPEPVTFDAKDLKAATRELSEDTAAQLRGDGYEVEAAGDAGPGIDPEGEPKPEGEPDGAPFSGSVAVGEPEPVDEPGAAAETADPLENTVEELIHAIGVEEPVVRRRVRAPAPPASEL